MQACHSDLLEWLQFISVFKSSQAILDSFIFSLRTRAEQGPGGGPVGTYTMIEENRPCFSCRGLVRCACFVPSQPRQGSVCPVPPRPSGLLWSGPHLPWQQQEARREQRVLEVRKWAGESREREEPWLGWTQPSPKEAMRSLLCT